MEPTHDSLSFLVTFQKRGFEWTWWDKNRQIWKVEWQNPSTLVKLRNKKGRQKKKNSKQYVFLNPAS